MADDNSITGAISTLVHGDDADHKHPPEELHGETERSSAEDQPASNKKFGLTAKKEDEDGELEYEVELETPFGKLEFEFEPTPKKEKKEKQRREREAARAAERDEKKAREKAEKQRMKALKRGGGAGSKILLALFVIALVGAIVAIAYWLFAREPDELDRESIPEDLRAVPEPEPQGARETIRARLRQALNAGRRASSEAQREQQRRYEELAGRE